MKRFFALLLTLAMLLSVCMSSAVGGTEQDPVVTKSYLDNTFVPSLMRTAEESINRRFDKILDDFKKSVSQSGSPSAILALMLKTAGYSLRTSSRPGRYQLPSGMFLGGALGTAFTPSDGSMRVYLSSSGALVDITEGKECTSGQALTAAHTYMVASESGTALYTNSSAEVTIDGPYFTLGTGSLQSASDPVQTTSPSDPNVHYTSYADALYELGLFLGTDKGYELGRSATRAESIIMLLRLLGELPTAQIYPVNDPFKDVPEWASHYVSYAYAMKYTAGTSATTFGTQQSVTAAQYLTFVLRALGYSDVGGDFYWEDAGDFAVSIGLISQSENAAFKTRFWRDEMVLVSYRALSAKLKDSHKTLAEKLIELGILDTVKASRIL